MIQFTSPLGCINRHTVTLCKLCRLLSFCSVRQNKHHCECYSITEHLKELGLYSGLNKITCVFVYDP